MVQGWHALQPEAPDTSSMTESATKKDDSNGTAHSSEPRVLEDRSPNWDSETGTSTFPNLVVDATKISQHDLLDSFFEQQTKTCFPTSSE